MPAGPTQRALVGIAAGVAVSVAIAAVVGAVDGPARPRPARLVPEDASGHLRRIAIHYVPQMDARVMPVWRQLFAALPADVEVEVAVQDAVDVKRLLAGLTSAGVPHLERFHPVVVGQALTTWSRDRMASLDVGGEGGVLSPPRTKAATGTRAGDWSAPFALSRDVYQERPRIADFVFEGGDLAASKSVVFADANLIGHNLGRGDATRAYLEGALHRAFSQRVVWLGDAIGEVPQHHIMMYAVPLDDRRVLVGDVHAGQRLLAAEPRGQGFAVNDDVDGDAARFDRAAELLAKAGFAVQRIPVVVLPGAGSYVTYTNAVFDRDAQGPIVYLPTYRLPALDDAAAAQYRALGYRVVPIDVSTVYQMNGSLGCLVNVMARG